MRSQKQIRDGRVGGTSPSCISLFTGAGGLDVGLEAAGFAVRLCVEMEPVARATLERNRPQWPLSTPGDIHLLPNAELLRQARVRRREVDLLAGGPPCQPCSKSGYWSLGDSRRLSDPRASTLAAYLRVVEATLPRVLLLENVRGISFRGKDEAVHYLRDGLARINCRNETAYDLSILHVNAADFGVPQLRERVLLIAARDGTPFEPPAPLRGPQGSGLAAYATAWDAIGDLRCEADGPDIQLSGKWADLLPSIPEGRNYLWHTPQLGGKPLFGWRTKYWSFLLKLAKNQPSWTIQAAPGPATGPFHWDNRRLSIRELARIQTFPDKYVFEGSYAEAQKQIGNAVPCALGEVLGVEIRRQLLRDGTRRRNPRLGTPASRMPTPPPEQPHPVPRRYLVLEAGHSPHPGTGKGPAARKRARDEHKPHRTEPVTPPA